MRVVVNSATSTAAGEKLAAELPEAIYVQADVADAADARRLVDAAVAAYGRLDVLVNNAGISVENRAPVTEVSAEQMRRTYETNVFGVVTVTNTLLPLLRRAKSARIVNVSSMLGSLTMAADPQGPFSAWPGAFLLAYNSSKTALNALTVMWASALRADGIKVNSADPGWVATDLNHNSGNSTVEQGAAIIVNLATLAADGPTGTFQAASGIRPW
jgi:NAD(P)-dependent dehydrogenase (short-subunit alcohol dehydrogenase family)